jgi:RsiW-degrading membrane proteinase PrsW (M82 family)
MLYITPVYVSVVALMIIDLTYVYTHPAAVVVWIRAIILVSLWYVFHSRLCQKNVACAY